METKRQEFDIEITLKGRLAVDPAAIEKVLAHESTKCSVDDWQAWVGSRYGRNFQTALVQALLADQEICSGFLLSLARFYAGEALTNDTPMLGEIGYDELPRLLARALPREHAETLRDLVRTGADLDANMPALYGGGQESRCVYSTKPMAVSLVKITRGDGTPEVLSTPGERADG